MKILTSLCSLRVYIWLFGLNTSEGATYGLLVESKTCSSSANLWGLVPKVSRSPLTPILTDLIEHIHSEFNESTFCGACSCTNRLAVGLDWKGPRSKLI